MEATRPPVPTGPRGGHGAANPGTHGRNASLHELIDALYQQPSRAVLTAALAWASDLLAGISHAARQAGEPIPPPAATAWQAFTAWARTVSEPPTRQEQRPA